MSDDQIKQLVIMIMPEIDFDSLKNDDKMTKFLSKLFETDFESMKINITED